MSELAGRPVHSDVSQEGRGNQPADAGRSPNSGRSLNSGHWPRGWPIDLPVALVVVTFSTWLWSRLIGTLGLGAPLIGAAIGFATAWLVRYFC